MGQLYLDGLDKAPEDDLFSKGEKAQSREGAQESEVSNPTKPVKRTGIWERLYSYFESEIKKGNNPRVKILFYRGRKGNLPSFESDENVYFIKYIPERNKSREEQEVFRFREKLDVAEVLDHAFKNFVDYSDPLPVSLLGRESDSILLKLGNEPEEEAKNKKDERIYEEFEARRHLVRKVPDKRRLLEDLWWNYYGRGGKKDLEKATALEIIRSYDARVRQSRKRKRN